MRRCEQVWQLSRDGDALNSDDFEYPKSGFSGMQKADFSCSGGQVRPCNRGRGPLQSQNGNAAFIEIMNDFRSGVLDEVGGVHPAVSQSTTRCA